MAVKWFYLTPPNFGANTFFPDTMILLTDGSVLIHNAESPQSASYPPRNEWYRYTPDAQGKYETGSWSAVIHMINARQFFSSGVLRDGRVYVIGGEISDDPAATSDSPLGEIFDPLTNKWSPMNKPAAFNWVAGDAAGCILADGRVLLGSLNTFRTAIWDPATDLWTEAGLGFTPGAPSSKSGSGNEETWALLQDGTVMAIDISNNPQTTEIYDPVTDLWTLVASHPPNLALTVVTDNSTNPATTATVNELGPCILLADGRLFAIGGTGHTGIYKPGAGWSAGPDFPPDSSASPIVPLMTNIDAPGCLLTSGKVLCVAGNTKNEGGANPFWSGPVTLFQYDPTTNLLKKLPTAQQPANNTDDTWATRFLLLPTGQVLFASMFINSIGIFNADPTDPPPKAAWKPVVTGFTPVMAVGHHYTISGSQINGLSQACIYGDDAQMATNYPIVRLTSTTSSTVVYARTHSFSTMGITPGPAVHTAIIDIPPAMPTGVYQLEVIANGIPSDWVIVTIAAAVPAIVVDLQNGLDFGIVCHATEYLSLDVFNVGGLDLIVDSVQTLSGSSDFTVLPNPVTPVTISPGDHVDFTVRFEPTTRDVLETAAIRITSNDPVTPNLDVTSSGTRGTGSLGAVIVDGGNFGDVCLDGFSDSQLTLNNNGPCQLSILDLAGSPEFLVPSVLSFPLIVSAGDSIEIPIRFQPTSFGAKSGAITITSDDLASPKVVKVSGNAPAPRLVTMVADSGNFGNVCLHSFADEPLTLCNAGPCALSVSNITSSSAEFLVPSLLDFPFTIAAGNAIEVPIRFRPAIHGAQSATITVLSNDPTGPHIIAVSGDAPPGKLAVTGSTYFGGVRACCREERTISICNVGDCKLHVSSVLFKRKNRHWKLINNPFPATLRPGSCLSVVIRYKATEKCPRSCDLVITSDDPHTSVKTLEVLAYTIWSDCCRKCCDDCQRGTCGKRHCAPCGCERCHDEHCNDENDDEQVAIE
jgi:Galactose oxidase, central domain